MNPEMIELAKRAVACKGWWWMPGMLTDVGGRIIAVYPMGGMDIVSSGTVFHVDGVDQGEVPDLTDPATLGCLLALVREVWQADWIYVVCDQVNDPEDGGYLWRVCVPWQSDIVAPTEAEALVIALESK